MIWTDPDNDEIGRRVVYTPPHGKQERGRIASISTAFIFVLYDGDNHSKATRREDLEWEDFDE